MSKRLSSTPIETSTLWEDAGYDCDHCGGRILRRIDRETGLRDRSCYQCEQCSCQWTLERRPLRVGKTPVCRAAQRGRASAAETAEPPYARWLLIALGAVLFFGLLRFGGGVVLRAALPLMLLAVGVLFFRYYRRRL